MHLFVILIALLFLANYAGGRENEEWESTAPEVRAWYRSLMQPDNPSISCCGESDAYWADSFEVSKNGGEYIAIITDPRNVPNRPSITLGTRIVVPNHKLKYDAGNPTSHGVIFVRYDSEADAFVVLCYVAPGGV